jgi:hypothetical protein
MKDMQRDGWEYELTVSLSIDRDTHLAIASKDRTNLFEGKEPFLISEQTGIDILKWCNEGVEPAPAVDINAVIDTVNGTTTRSELDTLYKSLSPETRANTDVLNACKAKGAEFATALQK